MGEIPRENPRENSSEREASSSRWQGQLGVGVGVGVSPLLVRTIFWHPFWVTEEGRTAICCVSSLGQGSQVMDFPGKCLLASCSFCTGLCGFCITVRIPPTMLQSFTKNLLYGFAQRGLLELQGQVFSPSHAPARSKGFGLGQGQIPRCFCLRLF